MFRNLFALMFAIALVMLAPNAAFAQQTIVYVDADSSNTAAPSPTNPASSWTGTGTSAYKYLQNGLKRASDLLVSNPSIPIQVWVATGTYRPDQGATVTLDEETETIPLRNKVGIYGGFVGSEPSTGFNTRNPLVNTTIITGEIGSAGLADNTYHIISSIRNDATAVIDGFTIRDGNANNTALSDPDQRVGGGALILGQDAPDPDDTDLEECLPAIVRCTFINCHARFGGAVYVHVDQQANPLIANCTFTDNLALKGGAIYIEGPSGHLVGGPDIVNSLFFDNTADFDTNVSGSGNGGAMYVQPAGVARVINCTLTLNIAEGTGAGGIHHDATCPTPPTRPSGPDVISSILWDNDSPQLVGGNEVEHSCVEGLEGVCTDFDIDVINNDPDFLNAASNFRLSSGSPCIDEGWSPTIESLGDTYDIDQNGSTTGAMADLDNRTRIVGAYSGTQDCRIVDMGAYEFASGGCSGDIAPTPAGDGVVNIDDLLALISGWGPCPSPPATCAADIAPAPCGDGTVNIDDLLALIGAWGCCPGFTCTPGDIPDEFYDCWDACSGKPDFGGCMDDCFKALCELGHTEYCD